MPSLSSLIALALALILLVSPFQTLASPLSVTVTSCATLDSNFPSSGRLDFTSAYAQLVDNTEGERGPTWESGKKLLRVSLFGTTGQAVSGYSNSTEKLATLFTTVSFLSSTVLSSTSSLCNSLSSSPYLNLPSDPTNCVIPAGPIALNLTLPLGSSYPLTPLRTHVRIVDTSTPANELACINLEVTPYYPHGFYYKLFLWIPVGIAIGYGLVLWGARAWAGWGVGMKAENERVGKRDGKWLRVLGTAVVSTVSGDVLVSSPSLLRFVTPGFRDIIYHLQFSTSLAMIAVQWPTFFYPIAAQGAWSTLVGNVTLAQGSNASSKLFNPLSSSYTPPSDFATQLSDPSKPIYLDADASNVLLHLDADPGIPSFAHAVGLREQDLFGTSAAIFLMICAAVIFLSLLIWFVHGLVDYVGSNGKRSNHGSVAGALSPRMFRETLRDESEDGSAGGGGKKKVAGGGAGPNGEHVPPTAVRRQWWKYKVKGGVGAFYASSLQGNLIRLLLLFHLPLTIYSVHQFTLWKSPTSPSAVSTLVLSVFVFVLLSLAAPAYLLFRLATIPGPKLYDATRTLLSLGPLYNLYGEGSQLYAAVLLGASLVAGIVIGAGGGSGTAQSIILLLLEIVLALVTSIWLPWGEGASMGGTSFVLCVLRIITMVLVLILCQAVDVGSSADSWITYAIIIIQAVVFLIFLLTLLVKIIEFITRLASNAPFDQSPDPYDSGLLGAMSKVSCCGEDLMRASGRRRKRRGHQTGRKGNTKRHSEGTSTQGMLDLSQRSTPATTPGGGAYHHAPTSSYGGGSYDPNGYAPRAIEEPPLDERGFIMSGWRPPTGAGGGPYSPNGYASMSSQQRQSFHGQQQQQGGPSMYPPSSPPPSNQGLLGGPAPSRGFSVVRGGRAVYEAPYALVPPTSPTAAEFLNGPPLPPSQQQRQQPSYQQPLSAAPLPSSPQNSSTTPAEAVRPKQHHRTRSETAVVENYSPGGSYAYGPGPTSYNQGPSFSQAGYAVGPPSRAPPPQQDDEIDIASDSDETTTPAPRRHSWFVRNSNHDVSDSEESTSGAATTEEDSAGATLQPTTAASTSTPPAVSSSLVVPAIVGTSASSTASRWSPFGKKKGRVSDGDATNAKLGPPVTSTSSSSSSTPGKSFSVVRPPKAGDKARSTDDHSSSSTLPTAGGAPPRSSFVVNRPNRPTPSSPASTPPALNSEATAPESPFRPAKSPYRTSSETARKE
ncbi:hypothetical protein BDY24DRAFT_180849 [Mrakia frigida]|uniref:uncharacterized protein n=1 Tax=Mrakia frigida TaxID=29902 RepID=UPI003FCC09DF